MSGWISCKDRLPKKNGDYLVTISSHNDSYVRIDILSFAKNLYKVDWYDFAGKKRPGWYDYDSEYGFIEYSEVIAWQELPEPYKET